MSSSTGPATVEVLWRPGCPFCVVLRSGLRRAGIETVERNIWSDEDARAAVRRAAGGDETVPTVLVGTRALVNPSVAQVVAAVRRECPDRTEELAAAGSAASRDRWAGPAWTAAVGALWLLLALWRPTTTWHLAPVLLAAAWPWVTGQDLRRGDRSAIGGLLGAGVGGLAAAAAATFALRGLDLLRGPALGWFPDPATEALVLGGGATVLAVAAVQVRAVRSPQARSAWIGSTRIAESDDVVVVEGNAYFPRAAVRPDALVPSGTTTVCPWKGVARYYSVRTDDGEVPDAAWSYPHPLPFARRVKGRIAFSDGVQIRARE